jgi:hypothetical protein
MPIRQLFYNPVFFCIYLILILMVFSYISTVISGWYSLLKSYKLIGKFNGVMFYLQIYTYYFYKIRLQLYVNVGVNDKGIYLSSVLFIRFIRPSLFIPWKDLEVSEPMKLYFFLDDMIRVINTKKHPEVKFILRDNLYKELKIIEKESSNNMHSGLVTVAK